MKKEHPIGQPFQLTYADGTTQNLIAREAESIYNEQWQTTFRKTCQGCVFCYTKASYCSGHRYFEEACKIGGCKIGKCSPEYREDGKYIHYKLLKITK